MCVCACECVCMCVNVWGGTSCRSRTSSALLPLQRSSRMSSRYAAPAHLLELLFLRYREVETETEVEAEMMLNHVWKIRGKIVKEKCLLKCEELT